MKNINQHFQKKETLIQSFKIFHGVISNKSLSLQSFLEGKLIINRSFALQIINANKWQLKLDYKDTERKELHFIT